MFHHILLIIYQFGCLFLSRVSPETWYSWVLLDWLCSQPWGSSDLYFPRGRIINTCHNTWLFKNKAKHGIRAWTQVLTLLYNTRFTNWVSSPLLEQNIPSTSNREDITTGTACVSPETLTKGSEGIQNGQIHRDRYRKAGGHMGHGDEAAPTTARNLELQRLYWVQHRDRGMLGDSLGRSSLWVSSFNL